MVIAVGSNFFYTVTLPVTLWFFDKTKASGPRRDDVLFIDARHTYRQIDRAHRDFTPEQIEFLANIVRLWRGESIEDTAGSPPLLAEHFGEERYSDVPGLCKVATIAEIEAQRWSLNPGRYVGAAATDDDHEDFVERMAELYEEFTGPVGQGRRTDDEGRRCHAGAARVTEWREVRLGDLCEHVTVGHVGKMTDQYCADGVIFFRSQDVRPFSLALATALRINPAFHQRLRKSSLRPGDVVVVRTGYPGTAAVVPNGIDEANCADLVIIRPGPALDGRFVAGHFNSAFGRSVVAGRLVGSAQQHFNVRVAADLTVRLPDRATQSRIGDVADAFTSMIENNRRRIEILEETARSLYREWFVRYRFPGHESTEFVDSPLGPIPLGWTVGTLEQLAQLRRKNLIPGRFPDEIFGHCSIPAYDTEQLSVLERALQ